MLSFFSNTWKSSLDRKPVLVGSIWLMRWVIL